MEDRKQSKIMKKVYEEIVEICEKAIKQEGFDKSKFQDLEDMVRKAKDHLMVFEWKEKYGLEIDANQTPFSRTYLNINDDLSFNYFNNAEEEKKSGSGRFISWADDDKQPLNEWLLRISFCTGAFIFGEDYPVDLFQRFWNELKEYNPDFVDSHNHGLYWRLDKAKDIYNNYRSIKNKYYELNKEESKQRKILKMEADLAKLKQETQNK